ncbi:hypothetical protein GUITHDRAFT_108339 [Guillardia theta CCMP2712]|uniref:Uncharacterized protein n=1 Tax=Guillardia theta (strain CCMP2712) TaxID=905079 RepID=L1JBH8_GUITC|nr:hypothetical protein GUITHDRAFT_108339 [Guillardia theta CCMP2712]EKX45888.1 hypothetical protein GUITHDRAFT_108339 [Guillardia theta CCMP2712]|eukprot:XP_005832868.1 hypothetical protein GUITHDRAFT_108339 [Guillardia theta CCMP2712]
MASLPAKRARDEETLSENSVQWKNQGSDLPLPEKPIMMAHFLGNLKSKLVDLYISIQKGHEQRIEELFSDVDETIASMYEQIAARNFSHQNANAKNMIDSWNEVLSQFKAILDGSDLLIQARAMVSCTLIFKLVSISLPNFVENFSTFLLGTFQINRHMLERLAEKLKKYVQVQDAENSFMHVQAFAASTGFLDEVSRCLFAESDLNTSFQWTSFTDEVLKCVEEISLLGRLCKGIEALSEGKNILSYVMEMQNTATAILKEACAFLEQTCLRNGFFLHNGFDGTEAEIFVSICNSIVNVCLVSTQQRKLGLMNAAYKD